MFLQSGPGVSSGWARMARGNPGGRDGSGEDSGGIGPHSVPHKTGPGE